MVYEASDEHTETDAYDIVDDAAEGERSRIVVGDVTLGSQRSFDRLLRPELPSLSDIVFFIHKETHKKYKKNARTFFSRNLLLAKTLGNFSYKLCKLAENTLRSRITIFANSFFFSKNQGKMFFFLLFTTVNPI